MLLGDAGRRRFAMRSSVCSPARVTRQQGSGGSGEKAKSSKLLDQFRAQSHEGRNGREVGPVVGRQTEIERDADPLEAAEEQPGTDRQAGRQQDRRRRGPRRPDLHQPGARAPEEQADTRSTWPRSSASSKYRGEFEEQLKKVMKEIMQPGDIASFIFDELLSPRRQQARRGARSTRPRSW